MTKCSIRANSTQPDEMCGCCPIGPPLDDRNTGGASPYLLHLIDLKLMIDVGCRFGFEDLTWDEWEGLKIIHVERKVAEQEAREQAEQDHKFKAEFSVRQVR